MSRRSEPSPARLVVSVIYREAGRFEEALARLAAEWGPPARISEVFPFDRTGYYREEMGEPLYRKFYVGERPFPRDALAHAKLAAERIEREFSECGRRTVNLDPGILTYENFVLATGKNYGHRVYLRDGVFADLTLTYRKGEYLPLPWTYPDYASATIRAFLGRLREESRAGRKRSA
jgi:hypothetical protein